ncbi:multiple organellar RNA editing factor 3, mitochondrial-like isoform X1 [Cucurbita moschata]|uniref:Multiple organellar RNA editing factor 3, mitochondrial-like isoform X1 n=1 Tax=Cucurbita moschata TaxID=3662 RepID=A0A6J1EUY8_CUCMO|nr:multiple organellar RNA editing factor 3, mitochondrial-like isoform X1 [Cucurbita moschata]
MLLDGCEYEHRLIVMEFPNEQKPTEEEMVNSYVKTLAAVVGRHRIKTDCKWITSRIGRLLWVLPDSYLDVPNAGDLFIVGKVIARDNKVVEIDLIHGTIDVEKLCILNGGNQY